MHLSFLFFMGFSRNTDQNCLETVIMHTFPLIVYQNRHRLSGRRAFVSCAIVLTHHEYSSKIQLYVLSLPMKEQAADDDILHHLDLWAAFFSARTWEELRMAAEKDPVIEKTVDEAYKLMMDEKVRRQCEAREEYYRIRNTDKLLLQRAEEKLQAAEQRIVSERDRADAAERELAELKRRLAEYEKM